MSTSSSSTSPPVFPLNFCLLLQVLIELFYIYFIHRRLVCAHITHYERISSKKQTYVTIHTSAAVPAGVCIVFPFVFVRPLFFSFQFVGIWCSCAVRIERAKRIRSCFTRLARQVIWTFSRCLCRACWRFDILLLLLLCCFSRYVLAV